MNQLVLEFYFLIYKIKLVNIEKINDLKKDELKIICKNCLSIFLGDKRSIKRVLGLIKGNGRDKMDYCSIKYQRQFEERYSKIKLQCSNCKVSITKLKSEVKKK